MPFKILIIIPCCHQFMTLIVVDDVTIEMF